MKREFLGWKRPPLHSAADWLREKFVKASIWDLANVIVVLPTSRAKRRLLELLVLAAEEKSLTLLPPVIETIGNLPEQLYEPRFAFASDLAQVQAWTAALKETPKEVLSHVVPFPPAASEQAAWRALAKLIQGTHRELASDKVTFEDAARAALELNQKEEAERWKALHAIALAYYKTLDDLKLWDRQTARLVALDKKEYQTDKQLVVIGCVDLNVTQRKILEQVGEQVTILTPAPKSAAAGFDAHGALEPEFWCNAPIELADEQVRVVNKPSDQAFIATSEAAKLAKTHEASEIVVGVIDDAVGPILEASLEQAGAKIHSAAGSSLARSSPIVLLRAIEEWLRDSSARTLAALVRHPLVYAWLTRHDSNFRGVDERPTIDLLSRLDKCITDRLVDAIPRPLRDAEGLGVIAHLVASATALLAELSGKPRGLGEWAAPFSKLLEKLAAADPPTDAEQIAIWKAFAEGCGAVWEEWRTLDASLSPKVSATEAIDLLCDALESASASIAAAPGAIEMLGWLELPLDDAEAAVVTGFNEGRVPSAVHGDLFLPNTLRVALSLTDNRRRLARDAFALRLLKETKQSLTLIAGRVDAEGNPLLPSRLLYFAEPEETARRVRRLYEDGEISARPRPAIASGIALPKASAFTLPEPRLDALGDDYPKAMRVTKFRDYLSCGYRYYLREIEKLEAIRDEVEELPPNRFGEMLHTVLKEFGDSPLKNETDPLKIEDFLFAALTECVKGAISGGGHAAVAVQVEQIRLRLRAFAKWQARRARDGWEIIHTEVEIGGKEENDKRAQLLVDRIPIELVGRIDRIDRREQDGRITIFDYKTSDEAKTPEKAHEISSGKRGIERWRDLQLPLYQILAAALDYRENIELGYIVLPKKGDECGERIAKWTPEDLEDAHETAREVVRKLRNKEFELSVPPPRYSEDFSPICRDRTLQSWLLAEEDDE